MIEIPDTTPRRVIGDVQQLTKGVMKIPEALASMGFSELREGQKEPVYMIMSGLDTIFVMPTSLGKSLVYTLPVVCLDWKAVVFSPLTALMQDQVKSLWRKNVRAAQLSGLQTDAENEEALRDWMAGKIQMLYVAPERLDNPKFKHAMNNVKPDMCVVDEMHCLSQWSDNFRHNYVHIGDFIEEYQPKVVCACTATCPKEVENDVRRVLRMQHAKLWKFMPRRENLILSSAPFTGYQDLAKRSVAVGGPCVIYCATQKEVEQCAVKLQELLPAGDTVIPFHGGMTPSVKNANLNLFMSGQVRVVVCTNAFGMGIDKSDIRGVIHRHFPGSPEALSQECVPDGALISTYSQIKTAKEVELVDTLPVLNPQNKEFHKASITKKFEREHIGDLIELRSKYGATLQTTPQHPVLVLSRTSNTGVYKPADQVVIGDTILSQKKLNFGSTETPYLLDLLKPYAEHLFVKVDSTFIDKIREVRSAAEVSRIFNLSRDYDYNCYKTQKSAPLSGVLTCASILGMSTEALSDHIEYFKTRSSKKIHLPKQLTEELCWFAGIVAADGNVMLVEGDPRFGCGCWRTRLFNTNADIIDKAEDVIKRLGLSVYRYVRSSSGGSKLAKEPLHVIEISSPVLVFLLRELGIPAGNRTYEVRVPRFMYKVPESLRGAYLSGVIDGCGNLSVYTNALQVHLACWYFISDLALLFRSLGFTASCSQEEYTRKSETVENRANRGYSLRIGSVEQLRALSRLCEPQACKDWTAWSDYDRDEALNYRKKSRLPELIIDSEVYLQDEVIDTHVVHYEGTVHNWTVEPGNQLWVCGVLTHNCGRAGRDGKDSWCITTYDQEAKDIQEYFFQMGNPEEADIRSVYDILLSESGNGKRPVRLTQTQLAGRAGIRNDVITSIIEILSGAGCIVRSSDTEKIAKIKLLEDPNGDTRFEEYTKTIRKSSKMDYAGYYEVNLDFLAAEVGLTRVTVTNHLKNLQASDKLEYVPPYRGAVTMVVGGIQLVDFVRLRDKRKRERAKLDKVLEYINTPDTLKHAWFDEYFEV